MGIYITLSVVLVIVVWFVFTFNNLIAKKNGFKEAWSGVDVQLKRRHDLIPNIVQTVKGYTSHERQLLENVTTLRSQCMSAKDSAERAVSESALSLGLSKLLAITENYPDLKANQNFLALQNMLTETEEQIQMARRYYNGSVKLFNIQVETFPSLIVANVMGLKAVEYFELSSPAEKEVPAVTL